MIFVFLSLKYFKTLLVHKENKKKLIANQ